MAHAARNWRDVRADSIERGQITEESVAAAHRKLDARIVAYRLRQLRESRDVT